jgi:lipopolysaccharide/colanic/teichoic acid biosynthesis glycosyltransferase
VGPRPFVTYEQEKFNEYQSQRLLAKPGLTCFWQAMGRCEMSFDELIELDLKYIKERSFWVDIKIIFKTVGVVVRSKDSY